uniref:Uncharacterized protein n=1 Tax=Salix viminalis TaxID=40686 RepID=A0A6N2MKL6_SALVM
MVYRGGYGAAGRSRNFRSSSRSSSFVPRMGEGVLLRNRRNTMENVSLPDPNKYIDEMNWDSESDNQLSLELEEARKPETRCQEESSFSLSDPWMLPVEHVKPTGWDVCDDWQGPRLLTGMIVGDG